jgi:hypothetical protein
MFGARLVGLVILAMALSGCSKGSAKTTDDPSGTNVIQATDAPLGSGSIEGVVTDDTLLPIQGAMVGILEVEGVAVTGADGAFAFRGLAPGAYVVQVNRLGFDAVSTKVDVVAEEVAPVQVILTPIVIQDTFVDVIQINLYMGCGGGLLVTSFTGGCAWTSTNVAGDHNVTGEVLSVVGELIWQQTAVLSSQEMTLTVGHNETRDAAGFTGFDHAYGSATGPSPVRVMEHAKFKGITGSTEDGLFMRFRVWTPGNAGGLPLLVLEQPLTVWSSMFYGEPATEDYSALPDA